MPWPAHSCALSAASSIYWESLIIEVEDLSSWCLGIGGGIKDNFQGEGLLVPISEHKKGLHGINGKEGAHVYITQDQALNPSPHLTSPQAVSVSSPSLWAHEQKVMEEIVLLQKPARKYQREPGEQFGVWLWTLEHLSRVR